MSRVEERSQTGPSPLFVVIDGMGGFQADQGSAGLVCTPADCFLSEVLSASTRRRVGIHCMPPRGGHPVKCGVSNNRTFVPTWHSVGY